jgi:coenzyme F420 biosynthesis associated uncharacterized protein
MPGLIDPKIASAVARRLSGETYDPTRPEIQRLQSDLTAAVDRSEELVASVSGISVPDPVRWAVISRAAWAEANIKGMSTLIAPLADKLGARIDTLPLPARIAQRGFVSAEVGAMLGYVSRRVLGQYDLLVPETPPESIPGWRRRRDPTQGAALYFVGTNMVETQERHGFVPEDFALWVAVHEVTHRFQFAGVPWLRDRFFGLIGRYLASAEMDVKGFASRLAVAGKKLVSRTTPQEERNAVYLFANEEQRAILDEVQALMAVVEGHGNYVMDTVGAEVIPSFSRMRSAFEKRREQTNLMQKVINGALGLEMKMRQYELGQQFCESVVAQGGQQALAQLWEHPDNLPNLAELRQPHDWVKRVA